MHSFWKGFIPGIIIPILVAWLFIKMSYHGNADYYQLLKSFIITNRLSTLFSLSAIPNLLLFFLFINREKWMTARGVIAATFIYAFVVIILHFTN